MLAKKRRIKYQGDISETRCSICWNKSKECKKGPKKCVCTTTLHDNNNKKICQHTFCFKCIDKWSKENNTCTLCRSKFQILICSKRIKKINYGNKRLITSILQALMHDDDVRQTLIMGVLNNDDMYIYIWDIVNRFTIRIEIGFNESGLNFAEIYPQFYSMVMFLRNQ